MLKEQGLHQKTILKSPVCLPLTTAFCIVLTNMVSSAKAYFPQWAGCIHTCGEAQFYAYRTVINDGLLTLQQHPHIGRLRPELSPHHRLFPAGQHVIIYRVNDVTVSVSRILHGRMDIGKHLQNIIS